MGIKSGRYHEQNNLPMPSTMQDVLANLEYCPAGRTNLRNPTMSPISIVNRTFVYHCRECLILSEVVVLG